MTDGQIRIGDNGEFLVEVHSSLGRPVEARIRADNGYVMVTCPAPGLMINPDEGLSGILIAMTAAGTQARDQRGSG